MPNYKEKYEYTITQNTFLDLMKTSTFIKPKHIGLIAFLYYTGVRITEALSLKKENFVLEENSIYTTIKRLKRSKKTAPLKLTLDKPYVKNIRSAILKTKNNKRVWSYCRKTGYNICVRFLRYPHYFRLNRITHFLLEGYTLAELQNWFGLSLTALNYYVGIVDINRMSKALK